jgi:hypothetical protein
LVAGIPVVFGDVQKGWLSTEALPRDIPGRAFLFDYSGTLKLIEALWPRVK